MPRPGAGSWDGPVQPLRTSVRTALALEPGHSFIADLVPPCPVLSGVTSTDPGTGTSNPALAENGVIHHHAGIMGGADLVPSIHGWTNPVAKVEISRVG